MASGRADHPEFTAAGLAAKARAEAATPCNTEVQSNVDAATRLGYIGVRADPVRDEEYTIAGLTGATATTLATAPAAVESEGIDE